MVQLMAERWLALPAVTKADAESPEWAERLGRQLLLAVAAAETSGWAARRVRRSELVAAGAGGMSGLEVRWDLQLAPAAVAAGVLLEVDRAELRATHGARPEQAVLRAEAAGVLHGLPVGEQPHEAAVRAALGGLPEAAGVLVWPRGRAWQAAFVRTPPGLRPPTRRG